MNKFIVTGNICKDTDLKNGIAKFSIANNEGFGDKKKTTFFNVTKFKADNIAKYLTKGTKVLIEGSIDIQEYKEKYYTNVLCFKLELLGSKNDVSNDVIPPPIEDDDELPF